MSTTVDYRVSFLLFLEAFLSFFSPLISRRRPIRLRRLINTLLKLCSRSQICETHTCTPVKTFFAANLLMVIASRLAVGELSPSVGNIERSSFIAFPLGLELDFRALLLQVVLDLHVVNTSVVSRTLRT